SFLSMPLYILLDKDGTRFNENHFVDFTGIWRHGDYLKVTNRGTCVIYGRSDATINRGGIRIGTSEIYRAVDYIKEVSDSLIVDIPDGEGDSSVFLFVMMKEGADLDDSIKKKITKQIR